MSRSYKVWISVEAEEDHETFDLDVPFSSSYCLDTDEAAIGAAIALNDLPDAVHALVARLDPCRFSDASGIGPALVIVKSLLNDLPERKEVTS